MRLSGERKMPRHQKNRHMLNLARAALEQLAFEEDYDTYIVGSYNRPFGNSYSQSRVDILFHAGVIKSDRQEITDEQLEYADELWEGLGEFIKTRCKLVPVD